MWRIDKMGTKYIIVSPRGGVKPKPSVKKKVKESNQYFDWYKRDDNAWEVLEKGEIED